MGGPCCPACATGVATVRPVTVIHVVPERHGEPSASAMAPDRPWPMRHASATATVPRAYPYGVGRTEALVDTADAVHTACFGRTDPLWKRTYGLVRDGDSGVGPGGSAGG